MPALMTWLLGILGALVVAEVAIVASLMRQRAEGPDEGSDEADQTTETAEAEEADEGIEPLDLSYAAKVVTREDGETVGESVGLADGRVIVKDSGTFYAVPQAQVAESGEGLVAQGVDWDRAREVGGEWADDHHDPMEFDADGMPQ